LKNSIFQGDVLMSEESFLELFPSTGGHRFFLMRAPAADADRLQTALEDRLADFGFDALTTRRRLADLFAVQNTYLSTFQSLGGLGLLLGTLGLATVQLRNVIARRGELALMRAAGFRRRRLAAVVMIENNLLLISGLGVGVMASLVAIMPHLLAGGARFAWLSLIGTLALVVAVGFVAGLAAVCAALRAPVIAALRGE
jgi:ABC-type antimicrobial peptide transport system permease subunit